MTLSDHCTNRLNIRVEHAPRLVVGVTDIVAGDGLLLTNLTHKCHDQYSFSLSELEVTIG
jgi:hypothetical protein